MRRRRTRKATDCVDQNAEVDFKAIYRDEASTVIADDGLALSVRWLVTGPPPSTGLPWGRGNTPELTVIFVHGFTLRMASWHFQRYQLAERWAGRNIKMVFYDQRGHGKSEPASAESSTMEQLGDDLASVIRAVAQTGPIVLVGHSMGGMTIMALARRYPKLFGHRGRVAGVALVSTAARGITEAGLGVGLNNPVVDAFRLSVRYVPRVVQAGRSITRGAVQPVLVAASFGPGYDSPAAGRAVESMIQNTSIASMVNFLKVLESHDESTALPTLAQVPTVVMCGDHDRLTPLASALRMYGELGEDAEFVVAEGCGHMLQMEDPGLVNDGIDALVSRSRLALGRPMMPWRGGARASDFVRRAVERGVRRE
nr:alpha/beta fold hydrolase [Gordonia zhaorongruii]